MQSGCGCEGAGGSWPGWGLAEALERPVVSSAALPCPSFAGLYFLAVATTAAATDQGGGLMHAKLRWLITINSQVPRIRREPEKDSEELRTKGEPQPWPAHRGGGLRRWGAAFLANEHGVWAA